MVKAALACFSDERASQHVAAVAKELLVKVALVLQCFETTEHVWTECRGYVFGGTIWYSGCFYKLKCKKIDTFVTKGRRGPAEVGSTWLVVWDCLELQKTFTKNKTRGRH